MTSAGFLDENEERSYPFTVDSPDGLWKDVVVDLFIVLSDDMPLDISDEDQTVRLSTMELVDDKWRFTFSLYDGSSVISTLGSVEVDVPRTAPDFATYYGSSGSSKSFAYLTVSRMDTLNQLTSPVSPEAEVELSAVIAPISGQVRTIKVYNQDRRQLVAPHFSSDPYSTPRDNYLLAKSNVGEFIPEVVSTEGTDITSEDVSIVAGFNCIVRTIERDRTVQLAFRLGAGDGQDCSRLDGDLEYYTPQGVLRSINGVFPQDGDLQLPVGYGTSIEEYPYTHKISLTIPIVPLSSSCPTPASNFHDAG